ncbi:MAG: tetratricopeptide repeat protein, partial [Myxococcales bacterium]|nr:tetratricopeptide repeat protein [Myxococcales bacterium]
MSWRSGARTSAAGLLLLALVGSSLRAQAPTKEELLEAEVKKLEDAYRRPGADRAALRSRIAQILRDSDDPRQVARGLRIQLDLEPGNQEVRRELAAAALEARRPEVAIRLFEQVVKARPDDMEARVGLGDS